MKHFYLIFNFVLIFLILASIFIKPAEDNISIKSLSKSLTTSVLAGLGNQPQVLSSVNSEVSENIVDRTISNLEKDISSHLVSGGILTDVLETQVGTMSAYGLDCQGCSGRVGAGYDAVGNHLFYHDPVYGELRIVAGDAKYPYGTVVRVKDSKIGTFLVIVLDRGGDIGIGRRYLFDLLFYTEADASQFGLSRNTTFEVLRYGY